MPTALGIHCGSLGPSKLPVVFFSREHVSIHRVPFKKEAWIPFNLGKGLSVADADLGANDGLIFLRSFIVVVKCGKPGEKQRPGNRGKRDSQMLLMHFLNKVCFLFFSRRGGD